MPLVQPWESSDCLSRDMFAAGYGDVIKSDLDVAYTRANALIQEIENDLESYRRIHPE